MSKRGRSVSRAERAAERETDDAPGDDSSGPSASPSQAAAPAAASALNAASMPTAMVPFGLTPLMMGSAGWQRGSFNRVTQAMLEWARARILPLEEMKRALAVSLDPSMATPIGRITSGLVSRGIMISETDPLFSNPTVRAQFYAFTEEKLISFTKAFVLSALRYGVVMLTWIPDAKWYGYPRVLDPIEFYTCYRSNLVGQVESVLIPLNQWPTSLPQNTLNQLSTSGAEQLFSREDGSSEDQIARGTQTKKAKDATLETETDTEPVSVWAIPAVTALRARLDQTRVKGSIACLAPKYRVLWLDPPTAETGSLTSAAARLAPLFEQLLCRELVYDIALYNRANPPVVTQKRPSDQDPFENVVARVTDATMGGCPKTALRGGAVSTGAAAASSSSVGGAEGAGRSQRKRAYLGNSIARLRAYATNTGQDPNDLLRKYGYQLKVPSGGDGERGPGDDVDVNELPLDSTYDFKHSVAVPDPPDILMLRNQYDEIAAIECGQPRMLWSHAAINNKNKTTASGERDPATRMAVDEKQQWATVISRVVNMIYAENLGAIKATKEAAAALQRQLDIATREQSNLETEVERRIAIRVEATRIAVYGHDAPTPRPPLEPEITAAAAAATSPPLSFPVLPPTPLPALERPNRSSLPRAAKKKEALVSRRVKRVKREPSVTATVESEPMRPMLEAAIATVATAASATSADEAVAARRTRASRLAAEYDRAIKPIPADVRREVEAEWARRFVVFPPTGDAGGSSDENGVIFAMTFSSLIDRKEAKLLFDRGMMDYNKYRPIAAMTAGVPVELLRETVDPAVLERRVPSPTGPGAAKPGSDASSSSSSSAARDS